MSPPEIVLSGIPAVPHACDLSQDVPRNRDISSYTLSDVLKGFALMNKVLKIQDA